MSLKDYPSQENAGRHGYVVHSIPEDMGHYTLIRDCPFCGKESRVVVPAQGLWDWEHGAFVQIAFPTLNADEREQVMTGTHGPCWDAAIPEEDDDEWKQRAIAEDIRFFAESMGPDTTVRRLSDDEVRQLFANPEED